MRGRILRLLLIVAIASVQLSARAERECRDDLADADGYTIRSIKVEGRWVPRMALPIKPGDRFSNAKVQEAMRAVQQALRGETRQEFELANLGAVGVLHITRCLRAEGREVDVIIQPRSVRVDLFEVGGNVLPIPRAPFATFYEAVPRPLLTLNPSFGAYQDKEYGFAPTAAIAGDLLQFARGARDQTSSLRVAADARKSVEHSFYNADARLGYSALRPGHLLEHLSLEAAYAGTEEPRADAEFERQAGEVGLALRLKPGAGWAQTIVVGGRYRFSANRFSIDDRDTDSDEHAAEFRLLAEGRAGGGFLRASFWADAAFPDRGSTYGRIAGLAAFQKEFLVALNQTIGVEAVIGGGKAWSPPAYAEFYGGNSERNFLYESIDSSALAAFPSGPLLRSFGEGQAARTRNGRGADGYWHANLNISLPIPGLSSPLIPNEEIAPGVSLKRLLKNKASDSVAHYAVELEEQGYAPAVALAKAEAMYGEVLPGIEFIADRANVYAVKPLLLGDVAGHEDSGGDRVQAAIGGGVQLTIVTAKMEAGYMQSVAGHRSGSGNLFARIVFENVF